MNKVNGLADFSTAVSTGNVTIDKVIMQTIWYYRNQYKSIKTIYLNRIHWSNLINWVDSKGVNPLEVMEFDFDGVALKKMPLETGKEMEIMFNNFDSSGRERMYSDLEKEFGLDRKDVIVKKEEENKKYTMVESFKNGSFLKDVKK